MGNEYDERLKRIEDKVDHVAEAIVSLARMEERMISLFRRMDLYDAAQAKVIERVDTLEHSTGNNGQALRFAERVFWILVAAGVTYFLSSGSGVQ